MAFSDAIGSGLDLTIAFLAQLRADDIDPAQLYKTVPLVNLTSTCSSDVTMPLAIWINACDSRAFRLYRAGRSPRARPRPWREGKEAVASTGITRSRACRV